MPRQKGDKTFLHLYIDKNVLARAKQLIPNLSEFVEMKLREYIVLVEAGITTGLEWARGGLNPGPRAYQARALTKLSHGPMKGGFEVDF